MSKENLRQDKTCLNCRYVVEKRFCANCGQENTQPRKTFHHLFTHFAEDLVHYDGGFWKTGKALLFRPALLTKEYLSGKRKSYVPPVKLYIFINFLTFFLLSVLPSKDFDNDKGLNLNNVTNREVVIDSVTQKPVVKITPVKDLKKDKLRIGHFETVRQLDSVQNAKPEGEKYGMVAYYVLHKVAEINENTTPEEMQEKFAESFQHNLPKVLFIYMPFFAFLLWLFHGKKRWYYFDHGIFTLHYFSFLLLTLTFSVILDSISSYIHEDLNEICMLLSVMILPIWWFFYFFRSHSRMYSERKLVSRLKGFGLFVINIFLILFFMIATMLYTALSI